LENIYKVDKSKLKCCMANKFMPLKKREIFALQRAKILNVKKGLLKMNSLRKVISKQNMGKEKC